MILAPFIDESMAVGAPRMRGDDPYLPKGTEMEETEMTREEFEMLRNLLLLQIRQAIEASSEEERIAKLQELMETIESK